MPSQAPSYKTTNGTAASNPLSEFTRLNGVVSLYSPSSSRTPRTPSNSLTTLTHTPAPTTILLFTWLNARPKHISYYTQAYRTLYPDARIILLTTNTTQFFQSEVRRRSAVLPGVHALLSSSSPPPSPGPLSSERILVHAFSNSGAKRLFAFANVYRTLSTHALSSNAVIFDSAPGVPTFRRDFSSLTVRARKWSWAAYVPFAMAVAILVAAVHVLVRWLPDWCSGDLVWPATRGLNDAAVMPRVGVRAYMYSERDGAVDYRDVEAHAKQAQEKGYTVLSEKVEGQGADHVLLFWGSWGESGYWGFVGRVWGLGVGVKE